jgi:hypothetical protein
MERRSVGAMVGGIVGISAAGILIFSTFFVALNSSCVIDSNGEQCFPDTGALVGLSVASLAALAVGIPLLVYGAKKVPVGASTSENALEGTLPQWAGAPGGTGWRWRF